MKISPTISSVRVSRMRFYFCFFQSFLCSLWRAWSSTISWEQRARLPRDSISAAAQRSTRLRGCCPRHSCSTLGQGTGTCSFPTASAGPPGAGLTPIWAWLWQCCPTGHPRVVGSSVRCGSGSQKLKLCSCSWGFFISTLKSFCSEISSQTCFSTLFLRRQIYICIRFILSEYTHSNDTSHWQCAVWWITPYKTHIWKENWRRNRIKSLYISDIMFCEDELQECLALLHSFGLFKGPTSVLQM